MQLIAVTNDARKPWYRVIYIQVLLAAGLGIVICHFYPDFGRSLKPFGDGFVKLVKMVISPIIFCTGVHGVASVQSLKKLGRVGMKTLVYFENVSTLASSLCWRWSICSTRRGF
jgi:aerobic C4-dicarboxylate transport protein